ncbi:hypothetical protein BDF22DRAFT_671576 [Syncephalis plumigaleata]|nr:hypothetical protein BDF22DRAFT_671576 [Syncephalis plumigaleata]
MNKEQLCQMDPQSLMASKSMTLLDKYTRDTWIHTMTGNHHDTTRHQLMYEERISLNWWLIPLVDTNLQCPTMTRLVKRQWNTILCYYSGRLLDSTQSQLIQTILPFSAYYRHYRVRELDRSYAEKDRKRVDEMKRKTRLFQLSWCPTSSVGDISTQSITLSFYAMKEDPSLSMMKHPCNGHLIIKQRIELSYIDWYRVMTSNRNTFNSTLICTTTDTIEDTEHHSWYYHMIQQLKQTQQCALVCVTSMQSTDNELNDTTNYALLVALTDTIAGFHYISNDYYELLQKQITDPNTTSNNTDCSKWIFQPWMIEYWWGECVVDDTPRVHRWLQSTMKPCNTTLNNVSSMTSKLTLNEQPLQRHKLDYILGCIEHRQRILVDKSKNALVESNENIPNNEEEAMQQLIRHYYMTLYLIENDKEQSTNTLSFVSELRRIRELFKQKEWSIERLHTWINASIMTVDGLTRRMALLSNRYRAIKNGDNICEDELTIDVHEQPYIEQILQQTSTPSWTWLKLRSVELQIVLLLESVMLRTDTIEQLKIETKDQERMQQWVDKLCIWASFVDYSSMMSGNNTSAISSGIHQNTTDPLILLHDGLMTSYGEQLQPLLQILHQTYEHDDKEKRDDTLTSTLGKRTRSTTSTRAMSLISKARSKQRLDNSSSSSSSSLSITQSVSPIPRRRRRRHDPDCIPERHGVNTGRFPFHHRQVYLDPKVHLSKMEKRPSSTRTRRLSSASATSNESSTTSFLSKRSMDALPISATTSTDNSIGK